MPYDGEFLAQELKDTITVLTKKLHDNPNGATSGIIVAIIVLLEEALERAQR